MMKEDKAAVVERELSEWGLNEETQDRKVPEDDNSLLEIADEITEVNRALLNRIEELEMSSRETDTTPPAPELDWQNEDIVSDRISRTHHIMDVIRAFEKDIDVTATREQTLRIDVQKAREALTIESKSRADLESRTNMLEAQIALLDDLRKEIPAAEEDRNRIANSLTSAKTELESITNERSVLSEKLADAEECARIIKKETSDLKEQSADLERKVEDTDMVRRELASTRNERDPLEERVQEFDKRLATSKASVETAKSDLDASCKLAHKLRTDVEGDRAQIADLKRQSNAVTAELSHVRTQIDKQAKVNRRLEAQVKTLTKNCEVVDTRLCSARGMLNRFNVAAVKFHQRTRKTLSQMHAHI